MNDLTEKWKKGELPEGHYYIKTRSETNIDEYIQWYKDHGIPSEKSFAYFNVTEVLDKVPSYEVWMEKTKSLKVLAEAYCKEKQQNKQLKELLEECSPYIGLSAASRTIKNSAGHKKDMKLLTKIDEVLK